MSVSGQQLVLNSENSGSSVSNDFTISFPGMGLNTRGCEVALSQITMTYSWNNISAAIGNNIIGYRTSSGGTTTFITLPDGNYVLNNISSYLQMSINQNSGTGTNIQIVANGTTIKTNVTLAGGYCLDLTRGTLYQMLGWTSPILITTQGLTASPTDANITTVNNVLVHCSLVSENYYNGTSSDILYTFPPAYLPGSLIAINPLPVIFTRINMDVVNSIRLYITDENNQSLNLNNQPVTVTLIVKKQN
jgi:hypothetical protein